MYHLVQQALTSVEYAVQLMIQSVTSALELMENDALITRVWTAKEHLVEQLYADASQRQYRQQRLVAQLRVQHKHVDGNTRVAEAGTGIVYRQQIQPCVQPTDV